VRCRSASRRSSVGEEAEPNVDFYSASTYYVLGIAIDLFAPIFAVSRVSGWTAHVLRQYANNRLIGPARIQPQYRSAMFHWTRAPRSVD
jgi:citrate synthase